MSERVITNKQLHSVAKNYGLKVRRRKGRWEVKDWPNQEVEWGWLGTTNEDAARLLAAKYTTDGSVESLLTKASNCD
jgi:hypothetical protein